jgi:hypothetical protein
MQFLLILIYSVLVGTSGTPLGDLYQPARCAGRLSSGNSKAPFALVAPLALSSNALAAPSSMHEPIMLCNELVIAELSPYGTTAFMPTPAPSFANNVFVATWRFTVAASAFSFSASLGVSRRLTFLLLSLSHSNGDVNCGNGKRYSSWGAWPPCVDCSIGHYCTSSDPRFSQNACPSVRGAWRDEGPSISPHLHLS